MDAEHAGQCNNPRASLFILADLLRLMLRRRFPK